MFKKLKQKIEEGVATAQGKSPGPKGTEPELIDEGNNTPQRMQKEDEAAIGVLVDLQGGAESGNNTSVEWATAQSLSGASTLDVSAADVGSSPSNGAPAELAVTQSMDVSTRSRTSSISSMTSETSSLFTPVTFGPRHALPSDVESASEAEDTGVSLGGVTKEELYSYYRKQQQRSQKYRWKYSQVVAAFKDVERERDKLRNTLTQAQDKAFRRISELKEQIQLDQLAKQHIEDNYFLMLDEKDELVKVLQTQVHLLKEGKEVPDELHARVSSIQESVAQKLTQQTSTPVGTPSKPSAEGDAGGSESAAALREKVKRLEILLNKCKESIKNNKDRNQQLTSDRDSLQERLQARDEDTRKTKEAFRDNQTKMAARMQEARRVIEELETDKALAIAEAKQQMHVTLEAKDQELFALKASVQQAKAEAEALRGRVDTLEKSGQEQLEKSRLVVHRVTEDNKRLRAEMADQIQRTEQSVEEERNAMLKEIRRGKTEALQVMQKQMDDKIQELGVEKEEALSQRDREWQDRLGHKDKEWEATLAERLMEKEVQREQAMAQLEQQMQRGFQTKEEHLQKTLQEKEEDMKLAIEERDLQKMAALSQTDTAKDELQQEVTTLTQAGGRPPTPPPGPGRLERELEQVKGQLAAVRAACRCQTSGSNTENSPGLDFTARGSRTGEDPSSGDVCEVEIGRDSDIEKKVLSSTERSEETLLPRCPVRVMRATSGEWIPVDSSDGPHGPEKDDTARDGAVPGDTAPDGAFPGDAVLDGTVPGDAVPDGAVPGEAVPDGMVPGDTVPDGAVPGDTAPDGAVPGGAVPDGVVPGDTAPDGMFPGDTTPDSAVPDEKGAAEPRQDDSGQSPLEPGLCVETLARRVEDLEREYQKYQHLKGAMKAAQDKHKQQVQQLSNQIEENSKRHKVKMDEMDRRHLWEKHELAESHEKALHHKVAEVREEFKLRLQETEQRHLEITQASSGDLENVYQSQMAALKVAHETALQEQFTQVEQFRKQVHELEHRCEQLVKDIASQSSGFESKIEELQHKLDAEKLNSEKLEKDKANVITEFEDKRSHLDNRVLELTAQCEMLKKSLEETVDASQCKENALHDQIKTLSDRNAELDAQMKQLQPEVAPPSVEEEKLQSAPEDVEPVVDGAVQEPVVVASESASVTGAAPPGPDSLAEARRQLETMAEEYEGKLAASAARAASLEGQVGLLQGQVRDLIEKENQLNSDLEQTKDDYEARLAAQTRAMDGLRDSVDTLQAIEQQLRAQLTSTEKECDQKLDLTSQLNQKQMDVMSQTFSANSAELQHILGELMQSREQMAHQMEARADEDDARIGELEQELGRLQQAVMMLEDQSAKLEAELSEKSKLLIQSQGEVTEKESQLEKARNKCLASEALAEEKEKCARQFESALEELKLTSQQQIEMLQSKSQTLESSLNETGSTSGELLKRISNLEESLMEKDQVIASFETKVKDFGLQIQKQGEQFQTQTLDVEESLVAKDSQIASLKERLKDSEALAGARDAAISDKSAEIEGLHQKFNQLREEAKAKLKELRSTIEELTGALESKESETRKQLEQKEAELDKRIQEVMDNVEVEQAARDLDHKAEVKVLNDRLDKERENMKQFKESVRTQFEQRQATVKATISKLKADFNTSIKERDDVIEAKLQSLARDKDKEKEVEMRQQRIKAMEEQTELNRKFGDIKAKLDEEVNFLRAEAESAKVRLQEAHQQNQSEKEAMMRHTETDKSEVMQQLEVARVEKGQFESKVRDLEEELANVSKHLDEEKAAYAELRRDLDELKEKLEREVEALNKEKEELMQNKDLSEEFEKLKESNKALTTEKEALQEQIRGVMEKHELEIQEKVTTELTLKEQVNEVTKRELALQEELKEYQNRSSQESEAMGKLREELAKVQAGHESELANLRKQVSEDSEERSNTWNQTETDIRKEYETKLTELKEKASAKLQELRKQIKERDAELSGLKEELQRKSEEFEETSAVKSQEFATFKEEREREDNERKQQIAAYEKRLAEMSGNDKELEAKLSELTEKLNVAEDKLNENISTFHVTVQGYQEQLQGQRESFETELMLWKTKVDETESQRKLGREEGETLSERLQVMEGKLKTSDELASNTKAELMKAQEEIVESVKKHEEAMATLEKTWQEKQQELKQRYRTKLKEIHERNETMIKEGSGKFAEERTSLELQLQDKEQQIKDLESRLQSNQVEWSEKVNSIEQSNVEKFESSQDAFKAAQERITVLESECQSIGAKRDELDASVNQLQQDISKREEDVMGLNKTRSDLEEVLAKLKRRHEEQLARVRNEHEAQLATLKENQDELTKVKRDHEEELTKVKRDHEEELTKVKRDHEEELTKLKRYHEEELTKTKTDHQEELASESTRLQAESAAKLAELKKKAEVRLNQIKKQLQGDKEGTMAELLDTVTTLQEKISQMEPHLQDMETSQKQFREQEFKWQEEKESLHEEWREKQSTWEGQRAEMAAAHVAEVEALRESLAAQLEAKDRAAQDSIQKAEASVTSAVAESQSRQDMEAQIASLNKTIERLRGDMREAKEQRATDMTTLELEHKKNLSELKAEYETQLEEVQESHMSKVKQLVKDFNIKFAEKEHEFQDTFTVSVDKSRRHEDKMAYEHRKEVEELHKELYEKESKTEELIEEYEGRMQELEEGHKVAERDLAMRIEALQMEVHSKTQELEHERSRAQEDAAGRMQELMGERQMLSLPPQESGGVLEEELTRQNHLALSALQSGSQSGQLLRQQVIEMAKKMEEMKIKHSMEVIELQQQVEMAGGHPARHLAGSGEGSGDVTDLASASEIQKLELQNMNLQAQIIQQSGESAKLKLRDRELTHELATLKSRVRAVEMGETPPASPGRHGANNSLNVSGISLVEPTELEYLRNILFEYMIGKETKTLAKVICTVVRFSDHQTSKVLEREDARLSWLGGTH